MTANEMKFNFMLKFDSLFEFSAPAYDDRQISWLLTEGQYRIFLDHYDPRNNKTQRGFEASEKRRRDLEQFIKSASISGGNITLSSNQVGVHPNGKFYDLPSDFFLVVEENAITSGLPLEEVLVKPIKHDEYRSNIRNPYKKPYNNLVWRMDYSRNTHRVGVTPASSKRTELITNGTTISDYRIRYLITPPDIICDEVTPANQVHCILDDTLHRTIVDEAVAIARAAVKDPDGYQVSRIEKNESED